MPATSGFGDGTAMHFGCCRRKLWIAAALNDCAFEARDDVLQRLQEISCPCSLQDGFGMLAPFALVAVWKPSPRSRDAAGHLALAESVRTNINCRLKEVAHRPLHRCLMD